MCSDNKQINLLCTAILTQAILDYRELRSLGVEGFTDKDSNSEYSISELDEFFESDWCKLLLRTIGGHYESKQIINKLRNEPIIPKNKSIGAYKDGVLVKQYNRLADITEFGNNKANICRCLNGLRKTSCGFSWRYIT